MLYLIEILHQTTTNLLVALLSVGCILSKFYIKPQRCAGYSCGRTVVSYRNSTSNHNCRTTTQTSGTVVSYRNSTSNHNSEFAIKSATPVVSYRNSTSNHNRMPSYTILYALYLIEILHQTTTIVCITRFDRRCILSKFYIKPQPDVEIKIVGAELYLIEILHQTTTANLEFLDAYLLYLIEILHQTTTPGQLPPIPLLLYLIEILHQTTTANSP